MSSRVGSGLALTAALLLALASLPVGHLIEVRTLSSWWSGNPTFAGAKEPSHLVELHVGLIKSAGCFPARFDDEAAGVEKGDIRECTDDDYKLARERKQPPQCGCQAVPLAMGFRIIKYTAFGFVMLMTLMLVALALAKQKVGIAKVVLVVAAINAISTIVLLVMGPAFRDGEASVPFGLGLILTFAAMGMSIVAALLSMRPVRPIRLVPATPPPPAWSAPLPSGNLPQPAAAPVDVLALLQDDALRPAQLGPEPVIGRSGPHAPIASPGGALPGPSGPLAPMGPSASQPLFQAAPQLRPLYEADGSNGLPPIKPPELPSRGPTPISMDAVNDLLGGPPPPPPPPAPKTLPPPLRGKPASLAPPIPSIPSIPPIPRPTGTTAPPPLKGNATMIGSAVSVPLPPSPGPARIPGADLGPTIPPPPIPPPPISKSTVAGLVAPMLPRPETDADDKLETVDFEKQDAFDAAATAARDPQPTPIDPMVLSTGDSTSPSLPFETSTSESPQFGGNTDVNDDLDTRAREKLEPATATDAGRVSAPVLTSAPLPVKTTGAMPIKVPMPAPGAKAKLPTPPAPVPAPSTSTSQQIKVPISTAPESLPPPKEAKPAVSGPSPACPQCEAPMAWVEEHLRFYCKSCRMYF